MRLYMLIIESSTTYFSLVFEKFDCLILTQAKRRQEWGKHNKDVCFIVCGNSYVPCNVIPQKGAVEDV